MRVPAPGAHGGDGARIAAAFGLDPDDVLDLSASLNPFAPDVVALAGKHLGELRRYPDVDRAEQLLAEALEVEHERLVLTAGGAQGIALVADHLGAGWVEEPEFSLYRRHLPRLDPAALRWRSDPHNPSGLLTEDTGAAVWDEAFLPLSAGVWTRDRPGWSLGSLTKAFACPGLRLGFVITPDEDDAAELRTRRPAWAVGGIACALVPELLENADPPGWTRRVAAARTVLEARLRAHGLSPLTSDAPWVLVPGAEGLRAALAPHGVVVRDCTSFGLAGHIRLAVSDEAGLERLNLALDQVLTGRIAPSSE